MRRRPPAEIAEIQCGEAWRRDFRRRLKRRRNARGALMDMVRNEVRNLNYNEFTETKSLEHASQQARARNYQDFLIVDVDSHHYENESYKEVYSYLESPVIKMEAMESINRGGRSAFLNSQVGYRGPGGRIPRHNLRKHQKVTGEHHRDIHL